ncbi:MAG: barstar family protein, partial [Terracidiphilus sp.]
PVWALDTPDRKAALHQLSENNSSIWAPDPAFTTFTGFFPIDPVAEILNMVLTVEEHHYRLSALRLFGVEPTNSLSEGMEGLGYLPVSGTKYQGLGFAKPLNRVEGVTDIRLDADGWQSSDDVYQAFFTAVGAPSWHGRNLDALYDSIGTGAINETEVPYRITIQNVEKMGNDAASFVHDFADLIRHLQTNGCPVELVVEQS